MPVSSAPSDPSDDYIRERLGAWSTIAGTNPDADDLVERALEILENQEQVSERLAKQSLQYVWRRQGLPHGDEWKRAENACRRVLRYVREGEAYR